MDGPIPIRLASIYVPFVGSIDTKLNTFDARVDVDMMWPSTPGDLKNFAADEVKFRPEFCPDLVVQNAGKLDKRLIPNANLNPFTVKEGSSNFVRVRCEGSFIEDFELEHFPFDIQDLKMTFTLSFTDATTAIFVLDSSATSFCVLTRYTALPEWNFVRLAAFCQIKENFTHATAAMIVRREPRIYVVKLGGFSILPNYFCLLAFILPSSDFNGRVSICLTLILALAAVLFVLQSMLPMTSKMTWIDRLLMGSLITITVITVLVTASGSLGGGGSSGRAVDVALFCLALLAVLGHSAYFLIASAHARAAENDKLVDPVVRYIVEEESKPTFLWEGEEALSKKFRRPSFLRRRPDEHIDAQLFQLEDINKGGSEGGVALATGHVAGHRPAN